MNETSHMKGIIQNYNTGHVKATAEVLASRLLRVVVFKVIRTSRGRRSGE